jgi:hypothetical protein
MEGGGRHAVLKKKVGFLLQQKHKNGPQFRSYVTLTIRIHPFISTSMLLDLLLRHPSCSGAVRHGWAVVELDVPPDMYAF